MAHSKFFPPPKQIFFTTQQTDKNEKKREKVRIKCVFAKLFNLNLLHFFFDTERKIIMKDERNSERMQKDGKAWELKSDGMEIGSRVVSRMKCFFCNLPTFRFYLDCRDFY